jgi:maltose O-acetyltransferase
VIGASQPQSVFETPTSEDPTGSGPDKTAAERPYLASDPELAAARRRARELLHRYNALRWVAAADRWTILTQLLGKIGRRVAIEPPFYCDYGSNITLGDDVFINFNCVVLDCARVAIGSNVLLGPAVQIYTAQHPLDPAIRGAGREKAAPIVVESDVWIGGGAILCPGVRVGHGSTIGAGSVVTRDVPPRVVAAGNPCRVIRRLP